MTRDFLVITLQSLYTVQLLQPRGQKHRVDAHTGEGAGGEAFSKIPAPLPLSSKQTGGGDLLPLRENLKL